MKMVHEEDSAPVDFNDVAQRYEEVLGGCTQALAQHILTLPQVGTTAPSISSPDARILDNACGTAFVAEEILRNGSDAQIHAVDAAPNMVAMAKTKLADKANVSCGVMPGEILEFPDEYFTHSFTNLGMLFFKSPADGAKELFRTLKPGGISIVTSWSRLGSVRDGIVPAQLAVHPDHKPFGFPIPPEWMNSERIERCLRDDGGFGSVEMVAHRVFYGAPTKKGLSDLLFDAYKDLALEGWPEEDSQKFAAALEENVDRSAQEYVMNDGKSGFGLPMDGIIAICQK